MYIYIYYINIIYIHITKPTCNIIKYNPYRWYNNIIAASNFAIFLVVQVLPSATPSNVSAEVAKEFLARRDGGIIRKMVIKTTHWATAKGATRNVIYIYIYIYVYIYVYLSISLSLSVAISRSHKYIYIYTYIYIYILIYCDLSIPQLGI